MDEAVFKVILEQFKEAFKAQKLPLDKSADKKLIINAAVSGAVLNRYHNPNIPVTPEEVAREAHDAYNAGAAMWHIHPRDPDTGYVAHGELRIKVHKDQCDRVFEFAPDIVTNVGAIYGPQTVVEGTNLVIEKSLLAENRVAPIVEPLCALGPNNRYIEVAISLVRTFALGGTLILSFNPRVGVQSDIKYLQSKGIRVELSPFSYMDIQDAEEWLFDTKMIKTPVIFDTIMGAHNAINPKALMEGMEYLFGFIRVMPKGPGVLWEAIVGGRYWLPLATTAIMLGADIIRIGLEDATHMYPHSTDLATSNGKLVEAVAGISRYLGREIASPAEARKIMGLRDIPRKH